MMQFKNFVILTLLASSVAFAAKKKGKDRSGEKVGTEHNFSDTWVKGKYQYADEALAIVEDEKKLDDLLSVRTDFKDRLRKEFKRR